MDSYYIYGLFKEDPYVYSYCFHVDTVNGNYCSYVHTYVYIAKHLKGIGFVVGIENKLSQENFYSSSFF